MADKLIIDDTGYETVIPENALRKHLYHDPEEVKAFIPGTIVGVVTKVGARVKAGETLLLLDAMKMHNEVCSPVNGIVTELSVSVNDRVDKGQLLARVKKG
jgi:biotin carboxyl carrier protein